MRAFLMKNIFGLLLFLCMVHGVSAAREAPEISPKGSTYWPLQAENQPMLVVDEKCTQVAPLYFSLSRRRTISAQWSVAKAAFLQVAADVPMSSQNHYHTHIGFCPVKAGEAGFLFRYTPF